MGRGANFKHYVGVGTGSVLIFEDHIQSTIISSERNDSEYEFSETAYDVSDIDKGNTQIRLLASNDGGFGEDEGFDQVEFFIDNVASYIFRDDNVFIPKPPQITEAPTIGMIAMDQVGAGSDNPYHQLKYITIEDLSTLVGSDGGGITEALLTASIVGLTTGISASNTTNLQFQFGSGLSGSIPDSNGPLNILTSSLFTASLATSSSYALSSSYAVTASYAESALSSSYAFSSSYAVSASFAPNDWYNVPTWNEVLTAGRDAQQDFYVNGNFKAIFGTNAAENSNHGIVTGKRCRNSI